MSDQHDAVQRRVASPGIAPRQPAESPGAQREYRGPAIDQSASARERSVELRQRFRQHGQLSDIRAAVEEDPRIGGRLSAFATAMRLRFQHTGDLGDANHAVAAAEAGVAATPERDPRRPARLSVLAAARGSRYIRTRELTDLSRAITVARQAAHSSQPDDPERRNRFAILGIALRLRAEHTKREEDLNESVGAARAALAIAPEHDSQLTSFQLNLATALGTRYRYLHHRPDNDEAISLLRGVIDSEQAPGGPSPSRLGNLSVMLRMRYQRNGDPGDVREAVLLARCAVDRISPGTPLEAQLWSTLAAAYSARFDRTQDGNDARQAMRAWRHAAASPTSPPCDRLYAAWSAGKLAYSLGDSVQAADSYRAAVQMLPVAAWFRLTRRSQEGALKPWTSLVGDAAASALSVHRPEAVLEVLEQGACRAVVRAARAKHCAGNAGLGGTRRR